MAQHDATSCLKCGNPKLQVKDSRNVFYQGFETVRRRRECPKCGHRHTTVEVATDLVEIAELGELVAELGGEDA